MPMVEEVDLNVQKDSEDPVVERCLLKLISFKPWVATLLLYKSIYKVVSLILLIPLNSLLHPPISVGY